MVYLFAIFFISFQANTVFADDPRLEKENVRLCFEEAKRYLPSADYSGAKNIDALLSACRDVDADCITETGESLRPFEKNSESFLEVIRACRGRGMGKCFREMKNRTASYDRREYAQVREMLKKCE